MKCNIFTNQTVYKDNSQAHETSALQWRFPHLGRVLEVPSVLGGACFIAALPFTQQNCIAIYVHVALVDAVYFCFMSHYLGHALVSYNCKCWCFLERVLQNIQFLYYIKNWSFLVVMQSRDNRNFLVQCIINLNIKISINIYT